MVPHRIQGLILNKLSISEREKSKQDFEIREAIIVGNSTFVKAKRRSGSTTAALISAFDYCMFHHKAKILFACHSYNASRGAYFLAKYHLDRLGISARFKKATIILGNSEINFVTPQTEVRGIKVDRIVLDNCDMPLQATCPVLQIQSYED